jgi:hypothetical protein
LVRSLASFALTVLLVLALAWGNCANCTAAQPAAPGNGAHDCCPKPQPAPKSCHQQPSEENHRCSFDNVDLSQAIAKDHTQHDCPLAITGVAPVLTPDAPHSPQVLEQAASIGPAALSLQLTPLRI